MTNYLDNSVLVAAFTNEKKTAAVQTWLNRREPNTLFVSDWVTTEFSSGLSIKLRTKQITEEHRAGALALFTRVAAASFSFLRVEAIHFHTAARFADQYALGLRAGDALHLAIAADHGLQLCTLDARLGHAAAAVGVRTLLL